MYKNEVSLKKRLLKSSLWLVGGKFFVRTVGLISMAILARLLLPEDFGKVAVITSISGMIELFFSFGTGNYLIQKTDPDENDYNTVWTISIIRGIIISSILFPICYFYTGQSGQENYVDIGLVLVFMTLIGSFRNTGFFVYAKKIDFSKDFIVKATSRVVAFIGTVSAAFYWRDYRAILIGLILTELSSVILTYILCSFRPKLSLSHWRDVFSFSIWVTIGNAIFSVTSRLDTIILSRFLGDGSAGLFTISRDIASLPTNELIVPMNVIMLSGLSEVKSNHDHFMALYLKVQALILMIAMPVGFGLVVIAPDFIPVFLGQGWEDTIFMVQLITAMMVIQMTSINFVPVIMSLGKTKIYMLRSIIYSAVRPAFFIYGVVQGGLIGAVYGFCVAGLFLTILENIILFSILKINFSNFMERIWRILVSLVIMLVACYLAELYIPENFDHILRLIIFISVGGISYMATILTLWNIVGRPAGAEEQLIGLIRNKI